MSKLVLYYADWCPHCVSYKPEWNAIKGILNKNGIKTEEYEHGTHKKEIEAAGVEGFPTLRYFKEGGEIEQVLDRSTAGILDLVGIESLQTGGGGGSHKYKKKYIDLKNMQLGGAANAAVYEHFSTLVNNYINSFTAPTFVDTAITPAPNNNAYGELTEFVASNHFSNDSTLFKHIFIEFITNPANKISLSNNTQLLQIVCALIYYFEHNFPTAEHVLTSFREIKMAIIRRNYPAAKEILDLFIDSHSTKYARFTIEEYVEIKREEEEEAKTKAPAAPTPAPVPAAAGGGDPYYHKYLKYIKKYLDLKNL